MDDYLYELPIKTLPGIGHVLEEKLKKRNVLTCGQLRMIPKVSLYVHYYYYYFHNLDRHRFNYVSNPKL